MKAALIAGLLALAGPALAGPPQWTWEAGKQTHNGAITLKSTSGSSTYSGTQNPTGAVAKTNQTAVTQPPTVIIQATSSSAYAEVIPLVVPELTSICPTGYISIFSTTSKTFNGMAVFNISGTRFSFSKYYIGNNSFHGFLIDNVFTSTNGWNESSSIVTTASIGHLEPIWAANLCQK